MPSGVLSSLCLAALRLTLGPFAVRDRTVARKLRSLVRRPSPGDFGFSARYRLALRSLSLDAPSATQMFHFWQRFRVASRVVSSDFRVSALRRCVLAGAMGSLGRRVRKRMKKIREERWQLRRTLLLGAWSRESSINDA